MSKMSEIDITLQDYEASLYSNGRLDPLTVALRLELLSYGVYEVKTLVECIDHEFDTMVFNGQLELF